MIDRILHDRYQIQEQLGKKTGRRTFLAKDLKTDDLVIIKLLTFSHEFEWDDLKLFEREADTLKNLNHELIPKYLDYFELNEANYKGFALIQNYIPAKSLENYLKEGRTFTEEEIKVLAKSILEILIYLHQQNPPIIHRDIKPSNILLANRSGHSIGKVYLVDFGSVQSIANQESGTITIVGTYGYMPPEQFGGRTVPASDLFSLGATLIYLATGNHPADLPQKEGKIQFENLVSLSSYFSYWISRLIEPSLDKRFLLAEIALEKLENVNQIQLKNSEIQKPINTKITLKKLTHELQIILPAEGFNVKSSWFLALTISYSLMVFIITAGFVLHWWNLFLFTPVLIPIWTSEFFMIKNIFRMLFEQTILSIDQEKITLQNKCFGLYLLSRKTSIDTINKLEMTAISFERHAHGTQRTIPPALIIWTETYDYKISSESKGYISITELEWLASELSEWLGLPITRRD